MGISFLSPSPEVDRLRIQTSVRQGKSAFTAVARRGSTIVGLTARGKPVLISPNRGPSRGVYTLSSSRWILDALRCCVDLGVISQAAFDAHDKRVRELIVARDRINDAKYLVKRLSEMGIKSPAALTKLARKKKPS